MKSKISIWLVGMFGAFILFSSFPPNSACAKAEKIVIGEKTALKSKVLDEKRDILIYIPGGYNQAQTSYPVLYLLDGGFHFHHVTGIIRFLSTNGLMPQMIVVGIPNTDRSRDLTPSHTSEIPTSGGADNFLKFIREELFPYIEENYRIQPYRILVGHSYGGLFSLHTLLNHPDMFQAHICISPWLIYDDQALLKQSRDILEKKVNLKKFLFMTVGNEPQILLAMDVFTKILKTSAPADLDWKYEKFDKDDHGSVVHNSIYNGLMQLYAGWKMPKDLEKNAVQAVNKHFQKLKNKFGYEVPVPENFLNRLGYMILTHKMYDQAIAVFKMNVEKYPNSANVYDSLGEALEGDGQNDAALKNYELAVKKAVQIKSPNLKVFEAHVERMKKKMVE